MREKLTIKTRNLLNNTSFDTLGSRIEPILLQQRLLGKHQRRIFSKFLEMIAVTTFVSFYYIKSFQPYILHYVLDNLLFWTEHLKSFDVRSESKV